MQRCTTLLVATALAGATLAFPSIGRRADAATPCSTAPLRATVELDRGLTLTRTTFRLGCATVGDALTFGPARVQFGPVAMYGTTHDTVTITPVNDPTTAQEAAAAGAQLHMTDVQIDAAISAYTHGALPFTPIASTTTTVSPGTQVDTTSAFTQLHTARRPAMPAPLARGDIYDAGCVHDTSYFDKYGCYRRHGGYTPTASIRFLVDAVQATGRGNSKYKATALGMRTSYAKAATVIQWSPSADVSVGSCRTVTSSLGFQGTGVALSSNVCPNKLHPTVSSHAFTSEWQGGSTGSSEGVTGIDMVGIFPKQSASGFSARLTFDECLHAWGLGC